MTDTTTEIPSNPVPSARYRLAWRGIEPRESALSGQHLAALAILTGRDDFTALEIHPAQGHQRLMMMLTAVVAVRAAAGADPATDTPEDIEDYVARAVAEVSSASIDEILGAISYDDIT